MVLDDLDEVIVGRSTCGRTERVGRTALLQVGDSETSRHHLAIRRTPSGWKVEDLGSLNGTLLEGERVDTAELSDGDVIEAGGAVLLFAVHSEPVGDERDRDLEGVLQLLADPARLQATRADQDHAGVGVLDGALDLGRQEIAAADLARVDPDVQAMIAERTLQGARDRVVVGAVRQEDVTHAVLPGRLTRWWAGAGARRFTTGLGRAAREVGLAQENRTARWRGRDESLGRVGTSAARQ